MDGWNVRIMPRIPIRLCIPRLFSLCNGFNALIVKKFISIHSYVQTYYVRVSSQHKIHIGKIQQSLISQTEKKPTSHLLSTPHHPPQERSSATLLLFLIHLGINTTAATTSAQKATLPTATPAISLG